MADGEVRVKLDEETERRLNAVAQAAGQSVDGYVADLIADHLAVDVDHTAYDDWAEDVRIAEESDRTGEYSSLEEGLTRFENDLESRLAAKE